MNAGELEAAELRIGNWVRSKDWQPNKSTGEFNYSPEFFEIDGRHLSDFGYFKNLIEPIPLNEDWLIRAGFEAVVNGLGIFVLDGYVSISSLFSGFPLTLDIDGNRMPLHNIRYVHQLQNLYMCLTGRELEITDTQTT